MGDIILKCPDENQSLEFSKELEKVNFEILMKYPENNRINSSKKNSKRSARERFLKGISKNEVHPKDKKLKFNNKDTKSQVASFQQAMRVLFIFGQCLGLKPIECSFQTDANKMRFNLWRSVHSILIGIAQTVALMLCLYRLLKNKINIGLIAFFAFYLTASLTTFLMIKIAYKWPKLIRSISQSRLDDYVDRKVKWKCIMATSFTIILSVIEHILSINSKLSVIRFCQPYSNVYETYVTMNFGWYSQLGLPISGPYIWTILQTLNVITTMNWNYSDAFIICMSLYLQSILKQINHSIVLASRKRYVQSSIWRALREDYNNATRLVRSFDEVISGVVFISFASNLFFICLQIYNIIGSGVKVMSCPNNSDLQVNDHDNTAYLIFSTVYLLGRFLTVSIIASGVHSESLTPVTALYDVPSSAYCPEVGRFIDQMNHTLVAISGLKFFYITRALVLSVAGTMVTYELVLLQFNSDVS